jgi:hypothetical protein
VKVLDDGSVIYTFRADMSQWKQATFSVDATTQHDLRQLLSDIDFLRLKKSYSNTSIADGTQRFAKLEVGAVHKSISYNNYFPSSATKIQNFIEENILHPNAAAISNAKVVTVTAQTAEKESFD